jgi:hypothetical protein
VHFCGQIAKTADPLSVLSILIASSPVMNSEEAFRKLQGILVHLQRVIHSRMDLFTFIIMAELGLDVTEILTQMQRHKACTNHP